MPSPLYARSQKELQDSALAEFRASNIGRLAAGIQATLRSASPEGLASRVGRSASKASPAANLLGEIRRSPLGSIVGAVERYAKGGSFDVAESLLNALGPIGGLIKSVVSSGKIKSEEEATRETISKAADLLRAFGWHVEQPSSLSARSVGEWADDVDEISRTLGQPIQGRQWEGRGKSLPFGIDPLTSAGKTREYIDVPSRGIHTRGPQKGTQYDQKRRWPVDHPIVTGEMVPTPKSTNVYSVGYDIETKSLFVRYQQSPATGSEPTHVPGPLYEYRNVPDEVFSSLYQYARSTQRAGEWIWDNVRQRGSQVAHKYSYELAGVGADGYVPRQAWYGVAVNPHTGDLSRGEWYRPRNIFTTTNQWRTSNRTDLQPVDVAAMKHNRPRRGPTTRSPNSKRK